MSRRDARTEPERGRAQLVEALKRPEVYGDGVAEVRVAETHISWVFLTGELAYKIKKPVKLPFLDFSTLERRRHFCEEELRVNRRLAPEIYLEVVPIGGSVESPVLGAEPAIEYAVKMRQFADDARLDRRLDDPGLADRLREFAARLDRFHSGLPALSPGDAGAAAAHEMLDHFAVLEKHAPRAAVEPIREWAEHASAVLAERIQARAASGRYRECHGDLHLENLLLRDGEIIAYDALEFDRKMREIDVASEVAFVAMDCAAHAHADLGWAFLTGYLEAGGDYDALGVLRFYLVHRALVRAKVRALKAEQKASESGRDALEPYLDAAQSFTAPRTPQLVITHGLSGSGKTYVTTRLIEALPAVRARSDLERKRLSGLDARARTGSRIGEGIYDESTTARTYERLAEIASVALANGFDAIVDATFLRAAERERFRALARDVGARFAILTCDAPEHVLRSRVAARMAENRDASEADAAVLERQLAAREPLSAAETPYRVAVATDRDLDVRAVSAALAKR